MDILIPILFTSGAVLFLTGSILSLVKALQG